MMTDCISKVAHTYAGGLRNVGTFAIILREDVLVRNVGTRFRLRL